METHPFIRLYGRHVQCKVKLYYSRELGKKRFEAFHTHLRRSKTASMQSDLPKQMARFLFSAQNNYFDKVKLLISSLVCKVPK